MKWLVKTDSLGCDGVHSCDDMLIFLSATNLIDTVCFGDSVHIILNFGGRSAPYTLQSSTGFVQDSIYYFDSGNDTISKTFTVLPQQENAYFNFTASVSDPWNANKTKDFSFSCSENQNAIAYLLNIQGEILSQAAFKNKTELSLYSFSQGIYFVKIITEKGLVIKRFVKE